MEKIESFVNYFEATGKDGSKIKFRRVTHLFLIRLPEEQEFVPGINKTKNEKGEPEDNHGEYIWAPPGELVNLAVSLEENPYTEKQFHPLSRNSRHIKKLLIATGFLEAS